MHSKTTRCETIIKISGHLIFTVLSVMAACFWQERTLILDAAFQSYLFIADGSPAIMVERFGAAMVQLLPLTGVWAGASLETVLLLYSLSIVLYHWILYSVCFHGLKDRKAALAILLFNVMLVGDAFYWMQNELLQAVSLMFVWWSLWLRRVNRGKSVFWEWLLSLLLATTVIYYHPLVFFPLAFVWCWLWLHPGRLAPGRYLLDAAVLFALIFSSKYVFRQPNFYDRGMTGQYVREFKFSLKNLLDSQSLRDFLAHLDDNLLLLLPLTALVTGFYIWKKRWWTAVLTPAFVLFYCLLIMQRFLQDDRWYIQESHYQALAVFLIVPLVWDVLPGILSGFPKTGKYVVVPVIILLAVRLSGIWNTSQSYTARLVYVRSLLEKTKKHEGRKFVIGEDQADRKILMMYWGLPFETLQISALESPDSARVIAIGENPDSLATRLFRDSMVTFLMIPRKAFRDLPQDHYRMSDTSAWKKLRL